MPSVLTQADFAAMGFGDPASNYVDYFNHRGVVTLQVPLSLVIVPEPGCVIQVILAIGMVWCRRVRRLSTTSLGCSCYFYYQLRGGMLLGNRG